MQDIVPDLLDAIQRDYAQRINSSATVKRIQGMITAGTATYAEANEYAIEIGNLLAEAFKAHISGDILPDGRMYFNIAQRILQPTMSENYELVATAAQQVQTSLNHAAGLGLKGLKADLNQDRIDGIVNRLASEETYDKVAWLLDDPIVTASQSIVDDTVHKNAEFHANAGLRPKIIRNAEPKCCKWCSNLDGEYDYGEVRSGSDVFRRHANCRCTVEFDPGSGKRQNVHTKRESGSIEDREMRIKQEQTKSDRASLLAETKSALVGEKVGGVEIKDVSDHVPDQMIARGVSINDMSDAVKNNLAVGNVKLDKKGRPSFSVVGERSTFYVNPESGIVTTTHKTHSKLIKKLKKGGNNDN